METKTYVVYSFNDLLADAKETARMQLYDLMDACNAEYRDTLNGFCAIFGVELKEWEVNAFGNFNYTIDRRQIHEAFRGKKKKDLLKLPQFFTGYWADDYVMETFKTAIKAGHTPYDAVDKALYALFKAWRDDMEYQVADEHLAEFCEINDIRFFKDGRIAP